MYCHCSHLIEMLPGLRPVSQTQSLLRNQYNLEYIFGYILLAAGAKITERKHLLLRWSPLSLFDNNVLLFPYFFFSLMMREWNQYFFLFLIILYLIVFFQFQDPIKWWLMPLFLFSKIRIESLPGNGLLFTVYCFQQECLSVAHQ